MNWLVGFLIHLFPNEFLVWTEEGKEDIGSMYNEKRNRTLTEKADTSEHYKNTVSINLLSNHSHNQKMD